MKRWTPMLVSLLWSICAVAYDDGRPNTPEDGFYWQPDKSGTGFALDVLGIERVFGAGYLYTRAGQPVFVTFGGPLQAIPGGWRVTGDLVRTENGQCLGNTTNCPYRAPTAAIVGQISLDFTAPNVVRVLAQTQADGVIAFDLVRQSTGTIGESLLGEWDALVDQAPAQGVYFLGEKLQIRAFDRFTISGRGEVHTYSGCVTFAEGRRDCSTLAVDGSSVVESGQQHFRIAVKAPDGKIARVYDFRRAVASGALTRSFDGDAYDCAREYTNADTCVAAKQPIRFVAYRSASRAYAETGAGTQ
ncbi:hypothetical protein [Tahibacter soli]|uniref:Uncharacterized protein n=1 Tax=Tahibacter soli TaxID=2983605 RepID=A0A9X4BK63_9GAMM|nr:hypothetical protein [Tahibacter soli]MDC8015806.1 hypothetical protein [Tahibacter soli]